MSDYEKEVSLPKVHPDPRVTSDLEGSDLKSPEAFHVLVEQEGKRKLVHAGDGIRYPPHIERVYVLFTDDVEYHIWMVSLETGLELSEGKIDRDTTKVHRLQSEGGSEWGKRWAVEVAFEERPGGWLCPTELRYEGIAMYAPIGHAVEYGIEDDGRDLLKRVR